MKQWKSWMNEWCDAALMHYRAATGWFHGWRWAFWVDVNVVFILWLKFNLVIVQNTLDFKSWILCDMVLYLHGFLICCFISSFTVSVFACLCNLSASSRTAPIAPLAVWGEGIPLWTVCPEASSFISFCNRIFFSEFFPRVHIESLGWVGNH